MFIITNEEVKICFKENILELQKDEKILIDNRLGLFSLLSKANPESIFKILKILQRVKKIGNLTYDDFYMRHTALIKIGQLSELTSVQTVLDDLLSFNDQQIIDAFFERNQWEVYREYLKNK